MAELLVRVCVSKILGEKYGVEKELSEVENQSKHYRHFKELNLLFDKYIKDRTKYKSISDFYPEIINLKRFVSIISIICLFVILFQNCEKKVEIPDEIQPQSDLKKAKPLPANIDSLSTVKSSIKVEKIDSIQYHSANNKIKFRTKPIVKISDFKKAQKLLKGIVDFAENKDFDEYYAIKQINFRNGTQLASPTEFDFAFVAW